MEQVKTRTNTKQVDFVIAHGHLYSVGEVEKLPCGCELTFEKRKPGIGLVKLVVWVAPSCPYDSPKVGRDLGFVCYKPIAERR